MVSTGKVTVWPLPERIHFYLILSLVLISFMRSGRAGPSFLTAERMQGNIFDRRRWRMEGENGGRSGRRAAVRVSAPAGAGHRKRCRRGSPPSGTPLGLSAIAARLNLIPVPQQATGEAAGGYFHHHTRFFRRAALLVPDARSQRSDFRISRRKWAQSFGFVLSFGGALTPHTASSGKATFLFCCRYPKATLTTCENPTTGGDKCRKVSKGALPLWSVRRGFQGGTHRKGSPWRSFVPFWRQKGTARAA